MSGPSGYGKRCSDGNNKVTPAKEGGREVIASRYRLHYLNVSIGIRFPPQNVANRVHRWLSPEAIDCASHPLIMYIAERVFSGELAEKIVFVPT